MGSPCARASENIEIGSHDVYHWCFYPFLIWKTSFEWSDVVCDVNGIMKAYRLQEK